MLRKAKPPWASGIILVCRDCDGYGKALSNGIREAVTHAGLRTSVRVVPCGCLDICPKRATVVVTAGQTATECTIVRAGKTSPRELRPLVERFVHDSLDHPPATIAHREESTP